MIADVLEEDRAPAVAPLFVSATVTPPERLSTLQALRALRGNMLESMDADLFRVPYRQFRWLGQRHLQVCDPALMQAVFLDHPELLPKSPLQVRALRPALRLGLILAEGAEWRRQRRAAAPAFRHEALRRMVDDVAAVAEAAAADLCRRAAEGPVDVEPAMTTATLEVVVRTLLAGEAETFDRAGLTRNLRQYLDAVAAPRLLDILGAPAWLPRPGGARYRRQVAAMRAEARQALERRRARGDEEGSDLLGALLAARDPESGRGLDDEDLVDNILSFLLAGHETTSILMTWALHLVAHAPDVQRRLAEEARAALGDGPVTADALERLPFHEQVLNETLRLFPPAPVAQRRALRNIDLGPVQVKRGDLVTCYFYVLHRSELLWDQPAAFDPDRFAPEHAQGRHRFSFMPFGGGPRVCIGARFAMNEAKTFLATFVRAFQVAPASDAQPLPVLRVTLRPENGVPLTVTPRVGG